VTDQVANLLLTPSRDDANLRAEGIPEERIRFVGNVMIDSLRHQLERAQGSTILKVLDLVEGEYAVLTLHRPSNVDEQNAFGRILDALAAIAARLPIVFPAHPRTLARMRDAGIEMGNVRLMEPIGYLEMLDLIAGAHVVVTDSGGLQEETTALGVPCLTIRPNTERPITIEMGTNTIAGTDTKDRGGSKSRIEQSTR
jgi:UDP-N-acetylglucosamine 2-epimerase (non-hydrolysing)